MLLPIFLATNSRLRIINDRFKEVAYIFLISDIRREIVDHAQTQENLSRTLREISSTLFALRDALVELSLLLQDLRFEMDQEERDKADAAFRAVFEKMRSNRGSDQFVGPR